MQLEETRLKHVCDKDRNKLGKYSRLSGAIRFSDGPAKLAADKKLEAVIIATPAHTHYEVAKTMLEAGKHVLVEKPLTMNHKQALELYDLSKKLNLALMVGHIYCFNPAVNYIKNVLRSGRLGNLYYGVGLRLGLGPIRSDASCTWDLATHDIAILDYLLNKIPAYVSAQASSFLQREKEIYDYATIQLKYDDNFQFGLTVSWYAAEKIRTWYLMGSKSMLKFNDMTKDAPITIYNKSVTVSFTEQGTVRNINNIVPTEGDAIIPYIQQDEPLLLEVKHFIESIKTGRRPLIDGEQGARVVKILEAIGESIRSYGKPVRV